MTRRLVRVTKQHNDECKRLLSLMGIPYVEAPCEAEAQCAALAKSGKVWAAASEDMDTLCFGAPILLRHLTFSEARKMPIDEFNLEKALNGLRNDIQGGKCFKLKHLVNNGDVSVSILSHSLTYLSLNYVDSLLIYVSC